LGCVGASYGGSFYLAGTQQPFQNLLLMMVFLIPKVCTGLLRKFSLRTGILVERIKTIPLLKKAYTTFSLMTLVEKWNKPLIIQGGKDSCTNWTRARSVSSSRFLYFPENHWVLKRL
jgi:hypothetical protein